MTIFFRLIGIFLLIGAIASCGEEAFPGAGTTTGTTTTTGTATTANNLTLLASSTSLGTSKNDEVTLSAIVQDQDNRAVSGVDVVFSAAGTGGTLQEGNYITSATGVATAILSTPLNPANRNISVSALSGTASDAIAISISGTTVSVSGQSSIVLGDTTTLTVFVKDSAGNGLASQTVTVSSALGNSLSATTLISDQSGQAQLTLTASIGGSEVVTVSGLGHTATFKIAISSDQFSFSAPVATSELNVGQSYPVTVNWLQNNVNVADNQTVRFFADRGTLSAATALTLNGAATVNIVSNGTGPAQITASVDSGPSASVAAEFVVDPATATTLSLKADKTNIGTSGKKGVLTATLRDVSSNLVKNVTVRFSITQGVTGGSISNSTDITDALGSASTIFTSTAVQSGADGITVHAEVDGVDCALTPGLCDDVLLTVSQGELFVSFATSNKLDAKDNTNYIKDFSVRVTNSGSNPVANAQVSLKLFPTFYRIGYYTKGLSDWEFGQGPAGGVVYFKCINEDFDKNGELDKNIEDLNRNGTLEPRNVASIPASVTTDATGSATFQLEYGKNFAHWLDVRITGTANVGGTEVLAFTDLTLPVLTSDFGFSLQSLPNQVSPWYSESSVLPWVNTVSDTSTCFIDLGLIPQGVAAIPGTAATDVKVRWDKMLAATQFMVYASTTSGDFSGGGALVATVSSNTTTPTTSVNISGLPSGLHYFVVRATVNSQDTAPSNESEYTVP